MRTPSRTWPLLFALLSGAAGLACEAAEPAPTAAFEAARARAAAPEREWRHYLGDAAVSHASPLSEIHRGNVASLEVAWSYDAGDIPDTGRAEMQFNPLVVEGVLYAASPSLRLFALDASTGEELWSFQPELPRRNWNTSRGAAWWSEGDEERLFFGAGTGLYAVDARTGRPVRGFGDGGRIDLLQGLGRDVRGDIMGLVLSSPPVVFEDLVIVGGRVSDLAGAAPGPVRAFDARDGSPRWVFHTVPRPGQVGHETWPEDAWRRSGGANAWAGLSVDAERGLVFVPTGSASFDYYGADRAGDNLFANTLLALDARSGERRWHFQAVRHDLWDRDLPAPPNLVEIVRGGNRIPAVAQVTKTGDTFLLHRETGAPLHPLEEVPVVGAAVAGEVPARSQPRPLRPPPFVRQHFSPDWAGRRPEAATELEARLADLRHGPLWSPPSLEGTVQYPGTDGGAEWGGAAWDAGSGLLYVNANEVPWLVRLVRAPADLGGGPAERYVAACSPCHGLDLRGDGATVPSLVTDDRLGVRDTYHVIRNGRGRMPAQGGVLGPWAALRVAWWLRGLPAEGVALDALAPDAADPAVGGAGFESAGYQKLLDLDGLPASAPPWGTLTALDLAAGTIRWRVPLGDYPALRDAGRTGLGAENYGGPVVTAGGLLFLAATPDARMRAFDAASGEILWETELPAAGFATPATYEAAGRQFVVIAAGGGKLGQPTGSRYVAFALPRDEPGAPR